MVLPICRSLDAVILLCDKSYRRLAEHRFNPHPGCFNCRDYSRSFVFMVASEIQSKCVFSGKELAIKLVKIT